MSWLLEKLYPMDIEMSSGSFLIKKNKKMSVIFY